MKNKKSLGQFFTTNVDHILQGYESLVKGKVVLDPFAGQGDLLEWAKKNGAKRVHGLDIDKKLISGSVKENDSLKLIQPHQFTITNPPYLAKNKMSKKMKEKYLIDGEEDLYLLAVRQVMNSCQNEGIIIVPVNFFSAENSDKIRKCFLDQYNITRINYFRNQVFADTTYNVVAFHFVRKLVHDHAVQVLNWNIFPNGEKISFDVEHQFSYRIAGRELNGITKIKSNVSRLTEDMVKSSYPETIDGYEMLSFFNDKQTSKKYYVSDAFLQMIKQNIILLNCIDTNGSEGAWIKAEDIRSYGKDCLIGKHSSRNIAYVIVPECSIGHQETIIVMFNNTLNALRKKYNSLFLTNFRDNDRKRVSFEFCYKLITYCHNLIKISNEKETKKPARNSV